MALTGDPGTPFESIESAHAYLCLLAEAIEGNRREVEAEWAVARRDGADRRERALELIEYKMTRLAQHVALSRRLLNDLRLLQRVIEARTIDDGL
jgi:hypothetical protein